MRPKPYISYSQYSTFLQSKEKYIDVYINGNKTENKYTEFGKMIAYGLENRNEDACEDIKIARKILEKPDEVEKEILVDFYGIPIFGILDGYKKNKILEYKTGKKPWTQKQVDESEQLTFYAILVSCLEKVKPEKIEFELTWLETFEDTDGELHLTGKHKTFKTSRKMVDLLKIYPRIKKVWEDIEKLINGL